MAYDSLSIGLSQGSQYKSYNSDKIKYLQPSVRLMSDSNALALTQSNSSTNSSLFSSISDYLFGQKRNPIKLYQEPGLDPGFKSAKCYEGFTGMLGPTAANTKNAQEAATMVKLEDQFNRSISDYSASHNLLMDKTQNYMLSKSSSNERNKNIYAVQGQNPDDIHPKWKGCYAGGKGLVYQEDMGNNATLSACKTRASDLGYSNFALTNNSNTNIDMNNNASKCYVGNSSDDNTSSANKTMVSYAFTQNKDATMGGLLKNGQIGTFNNTISTGLITDSPSVPGCDADVGGFINTKNSVASYGANCSATKKPKTVREQLGELCPKNPSHPDKITSNFDGISYNYDTYLFGPCTAAGTCDGSVPDDISKELLAGIQANKTCNSNRFNDGNYFYNTSPEGWTKTDCKKVWYDVPTSAHMQYECMQNLWKESGCTTIMNDADKTLREKYFTTNTEDVIKSMKTFATSTDDDHRTKCYGANKSLWPKPAEVDCSKFGDSDKNLPHKCIQELWNKAGCLTDSGFNETDWKTYGKKQMIGDMRDWATMTDDYHRTKCYGSDKSKWPAGPAPAPSPAPAPPPPPAPAPAPAPAPPPPSSPYHLSKVNNVSWMGSLQYAQSQKGRLPTYAEAIAYIQKIGKALVPDFNQWVAVTNGANNEYDWIEISGAPSPYPIGSSLVAAGGKPVFAQWYLNPSSNNWVLWVS